MKQALAQFARERILALSNDEIIALALSIDGTTIPAPAPPPSPRAVDNLVTKAPTPRVNLAGLDREILEGLAVGDGSMGHLIRNVNGTQAMIVRGIQRLKASGAVFQAGDRRFARYAATQEEADHRSSMARGVAPAPQAELELDADDEVEGE